MLFRLVFLLASLAPAVAADAPLISLTSPLDYQVFQRATATEGVIAARGKVNQSLHGAVIEARVSGESIPASHWQALDSTGDGEFHGRLAAPAGGWYQLEIRAKIADKTIAQISVKHVGIGEVFVVGGQSNSTNFGETKQATATGLVSSFDGSRWAPAIDPLPGVDGNGGSPWPVFGDLLVAKFKVPVGIVPVGSGATSVRNWLPKGDIIRIEPSRDYGLKKLDDGTWESAGTLYNRMVLRMRSLGPGGFRAMLWHQGESDANQADGHTLPGNQYRAALARIITSSRKEACWDVPWFVAQVSYHSPADTGSPDIRNAQKSVCDDHLAMLGPDTDTLTGLDRQNKGAGVHLSDRGLHAHAALWARKVEPFIDQQLKRHNR